MNASRLRVSRKPGMVAHWTRYDEGKPENKSYVMYNFRLH